MCGTEQAALEKRSVASDDNSDLSSDGIINLDHGDPTVFESYWRKLGDKCTISFNGDQSLSYFSDIKNLCWFLEPKLNEEIKRLHNVVGNVVANDYHIVVGNGSSQLIQAALYALSSMDELRPVNVVSAVPYYSSYPEIVDFVRSRLFKWAGDAHSFEEDGPYIEFVTSPNNPDGAIREPVVNRAQGKLVHDLAYYWPHYTPITAPANYDVMLFTFSKCTGHAGSRIGWALIKDMEVAKRMTEFVVVNTIGVSKESQLRAAKILGLISDGCLTVGSPCGTVNFFDYAQTLMKQRWEELRNAVKSNELFSLPKYPLQHCTFSRDLRETCPGFAWVKCKGNVDSEKVFREHKILTRSGRRFGDDTSFVRISMLSREAEFELFIQRLSAIKASP